MYKKLVLILIIIFTTFLFLLIIACHEEVNPPSTTTTTTVLPVEYQGVYLKKYNTGTPPNPDRITLTGTKWTYEIWGGSEYILNYESNIYYNNSIITQNFTKMNVNGTIKTLPILAYEDPSLKVYHYATSLKYKLIEQNKKYFYVENIYIGGNTTDLSGTWKYQECEENTSYKNEQDMGGGNIITYYSYDYTKMPEITFTSNKMLFKGYKYALKENNPFSEYIWYTFDVTADCTIDMGNKEIELGNIIVSNNLPSWISVIWGVDYPEETTSDKYIFEVVDNYLLFPWKKDDNKTIYYLEKQ